MVYCEDDKGDNYLGINPMMLKALETERYNIMETKD